MENNFWSDYRALVPIGEDPTDEKSLRMREDVILEHLPLTRRVALKMLKSMPNHVDKDDLESWATLGLLRAVQKFNHELGVPFEAYASQSMRSVIMDGIRDLDWAPRSLRRKNREILKAETELRNVHGRTPSNAEVAEKMGLAVQDISYTKYRSDIASHAYLAECDEAMNHKVDMEATEQAFQIRQAVVNAIKLLPFREAVVIVLHYYHGKKLAEVAKLLGVSEVKAGAIHTEAVTGIWTQIAQTIQTS